MTLKQALAIKAYFEAAETRIREEAGDAYGAACDIVRNHAYDAVNKWKREQEEKPRHVPIYKHAKDLP